MIISQQYVHVIVDIVSWLVPEVVRTESTNEGSSLVSRELTTTMAASCSLVCCGEERSSDKAVIGDYYIFTDYSSFCWKKNIDVIMHVHDCRAYFFCFKQQFLMYTWVL